MEFRILNAYRDGDMKAHRREAKNTALIECVQVAAEKAKWPLREEFKRMSSRTDGGGARAAVPAHRPDRAGGAPSRAAAHDVRSGTSGGRPIPAATANAARPGFANARAAAALARRGTFFLRVRFEETLIMTRHRGRGIASINYPIGMNLGGDPSQALVHSNPSGKFTVSLSSIDLGQGMKSVTRQICAETLGVPVEDVYVDTADSDTGPHCMGSFRLARHPSRRQCSDGRRERSARRHDGGGSRGA